jgi:hypothetical protein
MVNILIIFVFIVELLFLKYKYIIEWVFSKHSTDNLNYLTIELLLIIIPGICLVVFFTIVLIRNFCSLFIY